MSGSMAPPPAMAGQQQFSPQMLQAVIARLMQVPGAPQMMQAMMARGPQMGAPQPGGPPGAPPGMAPPSAPQGVPPQLAQMLAQRMQQGGPQPGGSPPPGAPPGMAPQGPPGAPQGGPPQGPPPGPPPPNPQQMMQQQAQQQQAAAMSQRQNPTPPPQGVPPGLAAFGQAAQARPGPMSMQQGQQMGLSAPEAGAMGRFGDTVVAHLTPGELTINPRMIPPKLMQNILQALQQNGIDPRSMIVGSPAAPKNPQTGMEEHNGLLSSLLPMILGIGGSVAAPELLPMLGLEGTLGAGAASALGGGLGSAAGTALGGGNAAQSITSGLGAGAGNYLAGSLSGGGSGGVGATDAPPSTSQPFGGGMPSGGPAAAGNSTMMSAAPFGSGSSPGAGFDTNAGSGATASGGPLSMGQLGLRGLGAAAGGYIGQSLAPATQNLTLPQGSIPQYSKTGPNPMSGASARPNFTNYNPFASVTGQPFNFYPQG